MNFVHLASPQLPFFLKALPASQTMHCCCFCRAGWLVPIGGLLLNLSVLSCPSFLGIVETPHCRAKTWLPEGLDDANCQVQAPQGVKLDFWEMRDGKEPGKHIPPSFSIPVTLQERSTVFSCIPSGEAPFAEGENLPSDLLCLIKWCHYSQASLYRASIFPHLISSFVFLSPLGK